MKKAVAVLAALAIAVVAYLGGFASEYANAHSTSRPTPEQYLQSLVAPYKLHWQYKKGSEVANDPAKALVFSVDKGTVTVGIDVVKILSLEHPNYDLHFDYGVVTEVLSHYAGPSAAFQTGLGFQYLYGATVGADGPYFWAFNDGAPTAYGIGVIEHRAISVAITPPEDQLKYLVGYYLFSVSAIQHSKK